MLPDLTARKRDLAVVVKPPMKKAAVWFLRGFGKCAPALGSMVQLRIQNAKPLPSKEIGRDSHKSRPTIVY